MFKHLIALQLCMLLSLTAAAKSQSPEAAPLNPAQLKSLASQYYLQKHLTSLRKAQTFALNRNPICEPVPSVGNCIDTVCSKLPSYQCDDASEIKEIAQSCGNNIDGSCIKAACDRLPSYQCDDRSELIEIAKSCSGYTSGSCVTSVCKHLPDYQCDDRSEILEVTQACSGLMDSSCVESICSKLPSYQCDDRKELIDIVRACKSP